MPRYRGDDIPSVSDYAHWGEEAPAIWVAENAYDMAHAGEPLDDPYEDDMLSRWTCEETGNDVDDCECPMHSEEADPDMYNIVDNVYDRKVREHDIDN